MDSSSMSTDATYAAFEKHDMPLPQASTLLVHRIIQERSAAKPDAEAVLSWDRNFSYGELDSMSSRLAEHLATLEFGPEKIVPLLFEKSAWTIVSMLAVLKAGGAFMTLDVSQPVSRLRSLISESGATVALSSATNYELCTSLVPKTVLVAEHTIPDTKSSQTNFSVPLDSPAYALATSGSTGTPKLVVTEHSQLSSFVTHLTNPMGFTESTRAFQFASYAFDPIIGDIFLTLAAGGTVCIPSEDERRSDVVGAMNRMRVNLAKLTPSLVSSLPDLIPANVPTLRTLVLGGETAPPSILETWADKAGLKLVYGSTECTISCVVQNARLGITVSGEIGQPFGSRAWIIKTIDNTGYELASEGEMGELVIEGPLVARGYLNNPQQSELKFIQRSSSRMYRTGDLVRRLEDGHLVYCGRTDNQVKIRGQRLELEDVEAYVRRALESTHHIIRNVLVDAATPLGAPSKQLVGVLSLGGTGPLGSLICDVDDAGASINLSPTTKQNFCIVVSQIETRMKSMVPAYMVPSLWVPIDEMPYTLSRKRDRQRLRRAIESLPTKWLAAFSQVDDEPPGGSAAENMVRTENEVLLQRLWSDILGAEATSIRPTDNFFHLGGNSLLVMRLISLARREGLVLVSDDVFAHPSLRSLAQKLTAAEQSVELEPYALLPPPKDAIQQETARQCGISLEAIEDILPLYSMQDHYVLSYPEAGRAKEEPWDWQQQIVFSLPTCFDISRFKSIWTDAIKRHSQLRTRVVETSHGMFQVAVRNEIAPTWQDAHDLDVYVRQDRDRSMSFGDELLRLAMVRSDQGSFFVLTMQHLIYDAYSRDLLFKEIEAAYLQQAQPTGEPSKMSQFIGFVKGADRQKAIEFWNAHLEDAKTKPLLKKPIGSTVTELETHSLTLEKPKMLLTSYTLATIIETSVALAVASILGCEDVVFYSDRAGRNLPVPGIQDLIAPTTLFLPLRVPVRRHQTVLELLHAHQAANAAMMPYEYLGWTELRQMDHLKDILAHSINLNINPYTTLSHLGTGLGLKVVDEHERWGDPFTVDVSIREVELHVGLYFDPGFVAEDVVLKLADNVEVAFQAVSNAHEARERTVGDVLSKLQSAGNA